ncbi:MAG: hypothetical protein Q7S47_00485 [bacterium]|nr:hypothetical protein [bacterium]
MQLRSSSIRNGFTVIELVVAIGVLMTIFGLGTFVSMDLYHAHLFEAEKSTLLSVLEKARGQAQHHMRGSAHGVSIQSPAAVLFSGASFSLRDTSQDISFPLSQAIHRSGLTEVVFASLTARVTTPGEILLVAGARSAAITINSEGRIDW